MFGSFAVRSNTPRDIDRFEQLWLASMVLSTFVAILMYDNTVSKVGGYRAALIEIALFGGAAALMVYTSRRRSNLARWLLVVASGLLMVPYMVVLGDLFDEYPAGYVSVAQIGLQAAAIYFLFTPNARAWFGHRHARSDGYPEG